MRPARRAADRRALWIVLGVAVAMRLPLLLAPPFLSSDIYRYVWDGRVQAAGINPYRYVPGRSGARRAARRRDLSRTSTAPTTRRTIYPPAAQADLRRRRPSSPTRLGDESWRWSASRRWRCCACCACSALAGLPRRALLIYAWNPLAVWAFAGNGHVDAPRSAASALALLARAADATALAGALLGGAALVKFLPGVDRAGALAALGLAAAGRLRGHRRCCSISLYIGAGSHVLGFLPGYTAEEGLDHGSGFYLLAGLAHVAAAAGRRAAALYRRRGRGAGSRLPCASRSRAARDRAGSRRRPASAATRRCWARR